MLLLRLHSEPLPSLTAPFVNMSDSQIIGEIRVLLDGYFNGLIAMGFGTGKDIQFNVHISIQISDSIKEYTH